MEFHHLLWVWIPVFFQVLHQSHCFHKSQEINPAKSQEFNHYKLQLLCQVWFHLLKIATSQPMPQVCNQVVDQVMGLLIFQFFILASTLMYHSHKHHRSFPVPISVSFSWHFNHYTVLFIFNQHKIFSSTNDASYVTAEFLDGYLRSYF